MNVLIRLFRIRMKFFKKEKVIIPTWMKVIPSHILENCPGVKNICIPDTVRKIEHDAFSGCCNLRKVHFDGYIPYIDKKAFSGLNNVRYEFSITIKDIHKQNMLKNIAPEKYCINPAVNTSKPEDTNCRTSETYVEETHNKGDILEVQREKLKEEFLSDENETEANTGEIVINKSDEKEENAVCEETPIVFPEEITALSEKAENLLSEKNEEENSIHEKDEVTLLEEVNKSSVIIPEETVEVPEINAESVINSVVKNTPTSTRKLSNESPEDICRKDRRRYATAHSITEIKIQDSFLQELVGRYSDMKSEYGIGTCLGMVRITPTEYRRLAQMVYSLIRNDSNISQINAFICTMFLVRTVIEVKYENNFWKTVNSILKLDEKQIYTYLTKAILHFCSSEKLYFHYYNGRRGYVQTVLIHAVLNSRNIYSIIDFIRDFYIEEMEESYNPETVDAEISLFIDAMKKDIRNEDFGNETTDISGIYYVSVAFKNACAIFEDAMHCCLECLLYNINSDYHGSSDISFTPRTFYNYFFKWKLHNKSCGNQTLPHDKKKKDITVKSRKISSEQMQRLSRLQRCSYYLDADGKIGLYIPRQKIPPEFSQKRIYLQILNDGNIMNDYTTECEIFGKFRFFSEESTVDLNHFYKNLSIKIVTEDDEIIFTSGSQLMRCYVIFDSNLDEYSGKTAPTERFYILADKNDEFFADANFGRKETYNYIVYSLDIDGECEISVGSHYLFATEENITGFKLNVDKSFLVKGVSAFAFGKEYQIYSQIPHIIFSVQPDMAEKYILDINDLHIAVSELTGNDTQSEINLVEILKPDEIGFVSIYLREKGKKKIIREWEICTFPDFTYTLDRKYYYTEKYAGLEDIYAENIDFNIEDYPCQFEITREKNIIVNGTYHNISFYVRIKLPIIYWEFNEEFNSLTGKKYIPFEVYNSIKNPVVEIPFEKYHIISENDVTRKEVSTSVGKLNIADFIVSSSESTLFSVSFNRNKLSLFELIHKPVIREISFGFSDNEINLSFIKIGNLTFYIKIYDTNENCVFEKEFSGLSDGRICISETLARLDNGIYKAMILKKDDEEFGFESEVEYKQIICHHFIVGEPLEVYCNNKNELLNIDYCTDNGEKCQAVNNFYCENLRNIDNDSGLYTADAFFMRNGERIYFQKANPVKIELLEMTESVLKISMTDREKDGFLYEKNRGYLVYDENGTHDYYSYSSPDYYMIRLNMGGN